MNPTAQSVTDVNLGDTQFYITNEFHPYLAKLRAIGAVHWTQAWPDRGFWNVVRYRDVQEVALNTKVFSSAQVGDVLPPDPNMYNDPAISRSSGMGLMPPWQDPPRHDQIRRLVVGPFTPDNAAKLDDECRRKSEELIEGILERGECEFVGEVAGKLPMHIICSLMGAPREDWDMLYDQVNSFFNYNEPEFQLGETPGETMQIAIQLQFSYIRNLLLERRRKPKDDITTMIANVKVDGKLLSEEEASWWAWAILTAGFETTRAVTSLGAMLLTQHPDQMRRLRDNPQEGMLAANEFCRWATPAHSMLRVALEDTQIGDQPIKAGDWVLLWLTSANRDERAFDDPSQLNLTRNPNVHVAFGWGIHNCLGKRIGLVEINRMIATVLSRLDDIEIAGPVVWTTGAAMGLKRLPLRFRSKH